MIVYVLTKGEYEDRCITGVVSSEKDAIYLTQDTNILGDDYTEFIVIDKVPDLSSYYRWTVHITLADSSISKIEKESVIDHEADWCSKEEDIQALLTHNLDDVLEYWTDGIAFEASILTDKDEEQVKKIALDYYSNLFGFKPEEID